MSARGDDVTDLFNSFGGDKSRYQELTRTSDAQAAEQRWPLFQMVPAQAPEAPPLLSEQEKQRWLNERPASRAQAGLSRSMNLEDGMAKSLRQLASDGLPGRSPVAEQAPRIAAPGQALQALTPTRPVPSVASVPARGSLFRQPVQAQAPADDTSGAPRLFSKKYADEVTAPEPTPASSNRLSSIFQRLEGKEEAAPSSRKLPFLRQLDRG